MPSVPVTASSSVGHGSHVGRGVRALALPTVGLVCATLAVLGGATGSEVAPGAEVLAAAQAPITARGGAAVALHRWPTGDVPTGDREVEAPDRPDATPSVEPEPAGRTRHEASEAAPRRPQPDPASLDRAPASQPRPAGAPPTSAETLAPAPDGAAPPPEPEPDPPAAEPASDPATGPQRDHTLEAAVLSYLNERRAEHGLGALPRLGCVDGLASQWAEHQARAGSISHRPGLADAYAAACGQTSAVAENVGHAATVDQLNQLWWDSGGHRANILSAQFGHVGIGVWRDPSGMLWAAVDFA